MRLSLPGCEFCSGPDAPDKGLTDLPVGSYWVAVKDINFNYQRLDI